jgi:hypothetical protein
LLLQARFPTSSDHSITLPEHKPARSGEGAVNTQEEEVSLIDNLKMILSTIGPTMPEIGDEMADGTIYAGISPDTHKPVYARPKDEPGTYNFNEAKEHAKHIGHGFHVPTRGELKVLYENRNRGRLKDTFNETGSYPTGWYQSSTPYGFNDAWAQCFSDGGQYYGDRSDGSSLRLVR